MIKIAFMTGSRTIIRFNIEGRAIRYFDRMWKDGIQVMPKDQNLIEKLRRSGQPNLKEYAKLIIESNSGDSLKEYDNCKTEEELAEMVREDCLKKGLMEVK